MKRKALKPGLRIFIATAIIGFPLPGTYKIV
jgi:hypothetical protein